MTDEEKIKLLTAMLQKVSRMVGFFVKAEIQDLLEIVKSSKDAVEE